MDQTMEIDITDPIWALQLPPRKRKATVHYTDATDVKRKRRAVTTSKQTQAILRSQKNKIKGMKPVPTKSDKNTNKLYSCQFCNKQFKSVSYLKLHLSIHYGIKDFTCEFCGDNFRQQIHLQTHLLRHYGIKDFECWNCHKRFRQASNLNTHISRCKGKENDTKKIKTKKQLVKKFSTKNQKQISSIIKDRNTVLGKRSKSITSSSGSLLSPPPSSSPLLMYNSVQNQSCTSSLFSNLNNNMNAKVFDEEGGKMDVDDDILQKSTSISYEADEVTSSNSTQDSSSRNSFIVQDIEIQPPSYAHLTEQNLEFAEPLISDEEGPNITLSLMEERERCHLIESLYEDLDQFAADPISISIQELMKSYDSQSSTSSSPCYSNSLSDLDMKFNKSDDGFSVNVQDIFWDTAHSCCGTDLSQSGNRNCANEISNSFSLSIPGHLNYYYRV